MSTPLYNVTTFVGSGVASNIYQGLVENVGGNDFMALMLITIILIIFTLMFRLPLEASAILVLPFLILAFAFNFDSLSVLGVTMLYLGWIVGKQFLATT